ncbi:MAG: UDP-N-acetylmuramate--L-alanine ligase [Candidatus Cryosericum sp.]
MARFSREGTRFFLIGICGAGMSSLALLLRSMGMEVRGSDQAPDGPVAERLASCGIRVIPEAAAVDGMRNGETVVYSSAIHPDNVVMMAAKAKNAEVFHRVDVLADIAADYFLIAVSGTHGKTTTSGMVGYVLARQGFAPTIYVGGRIVGFDNEFPAHGTPHVLIDGRPIMVLETDESDGSFLKFRPDIAIVTNIDRDHLGAYGNSMDNLVEAFSRFVRQCADRGGVVVGFGDDKVVARMVENAPRHMIYGTGASNQVRVVYDAASNSARIMTHELDYPFTMERGDEKTYLNAVAAALACDATGIRMADALHILQAFPGMERRMQVLATFNGAVILTDHADHPTEIAATMQAIGVRYPGRKIRLVLQPHRYSRVASCLETYAPAVKGAYQIILMDIFSAGERSDDPEALNSELRNRIQDVMGSALAPCMASGDVLDYLRATLSHSDVIVFMGPGDVNKLGLRFCALLKSDNAVESGLASLLEEAQGQEKYS